jgi:hypothetical protein
VVLPFHLLVVAEQKEQSTGHAEGFRFRKKAPRISAMYPLISEGNIASIQCDLSQPARISKRLSPRRPIGLRGEMNVPGNPSISEIDRMTQKANQTKDDEQTCDSDCKSGPVREAGGTTGAGNPSPGGADRTGGATSGVNEEEATKRRKLDPSPPE